MSDEGARRLHRAIAEACLGSRAGEAITRDLRSFLEAHGVEADDVNAILAAPPRLAVYRSLVRNGLGSVIERMLPRTRARMNAACDGRFDADLAAFANEIGPRTHYLRDVPAELFAWAEPRWRADAAVPAYLVDLAAYELAAFAVGASASVHPRAGASAEVALDRPLAFAESARLLRFAWAVHELDGTSAATGGSADVLPARRPSPQRGQHQEDGPESAAGAEPPRRDVRLLAYRDADHRVRWLELTPLAADVVDRLLSGQPLGDAVQAACAEHGVPPATVLEDVARLLADLGSRGVVLGARVRA
jgi:hypothetical protein